MHRIFLGLALATFFLPRIGFSQSPAVKAELITAIGKLSQRDVSLVGGIDEEAQEKPTGIAGGVQQIVVSGMNSGASSEYRGDVEITIFKSGDLAIASKDDLPGLKVYKQGDDVLSLQAHLQEPYSTSKLVSNVSKLVDWTALGPAVESATKIRTSTKGQDTEFRVVLDPGFIPKEAMPVPPGLAAGGGGNVRIQVANPMLPSIVEFTGTFTLNASKELVSIEYSLQYDDPMKGMMAKAMKGGGAVFQLGAKPAKTVEETDLGKLIIYDFDVVEKPSSKVGAFVNEAKAMLKNRK